MKCHVDSFAQNQDLLAFLNCKKIHLLFLDIPIFEEYHRKQRLQFNVSIERHTTFSPTQWSIGFEKIFYVSMVLNRSSNPTLTLIVSKDKII